IVRAGTEDKAMVVLVYKTPGSDVDQKTIDGLDILAEAFSRALRERIREGEGGTYDPSVVAVTSVERGQSAIVATFGADPARMDELLAAAKEEAARLAADGVPERRLSEIVLASKKDLESASGENAYWASALAEALMYGYPLATFEGAIERLDSYTIEWTRAAALRYLDAENLAVFMLLPADK
ncbi:MAG: insulinase family protein, partial [Spirochaetaceae bacterium]|nr:insulinase family protein [Spirochaetaceae bacterium]